MKKTLRISLYGLLLLSSCNSTPTGYTVEGSIDDSTYNGKTIYIKRFDDQKIIDSTRIENNRFSFCGEIDTAVFCRIDISLDKYVSFILESGHISADVPHHCATGSSLNDAKNKIETLADSLRNTINSKMQALRSQYPATDEGNKRLQRQVQKYSDSLQAHIDSLSISLFAAHNNDALGEYLVRSPFFPSDLKLKEKITDNFGPWLKNRIFIKYLIRQLEQEKKSAVGQPYINIEGRDVNGNNIALSDFFGRGNYVLMDMWASWCGPCKQEIPNLAYLHNKYKDKGLTVVGIFVWDTQEHFIASVEEKGITWPQIFNSQNNAMQPMKQYGINSIPQIILFSPDGIILKRDLRGDSMIDFVEGVLQK